MTQARSFSIVLPLVAVLGCEGAKEGAPRPNAGIENAVDLTIVPAMSRFSAEAEEFEAQSEEFCAEPSAERLTALRDRWLTLSAAWNQAGVYYLGPLDDDPIEPTIFFIESMRPRGTDYTSTVRAALDTAVSGDQILDEAFFGRLQFNRVGLLALEVLVFEDGPRAVDTTDTEMVVDGYREAPRKCEYLMGIAEQLADRAAAVESGWTEEFGDTGLPFRDLLLTGQLEDGMLPTAAVIRTAARHIEYLHSRKLDGIMDARLAAAARPEGRPFFVNLAAGLESLEDLLEPPGADVSLYDRMEARGAQAQADSVRALFGAARASLESDDRATALPAFVALERGFRNDVVEGLDIDLGIGFADGD